MIYYPNTYVNNHKFISIVDDVILTFVLSKLFMDENLPKIDSL